MAVRRNYDATLTGGTYQCGSLSTRCRAQIEHAISRLNRKQQRHCLGRFVLNRNLARSKRLYLSWASAAYRKRTSDQNPRSRSQAPFRHGAEHSLTSAEILHCATQLWRLIVGAYQRDRLLLAKPQQPPFDEPCGMRMQNSEPLGKRKPSWQQCFGGRLCFTLRLA